LGTCWVSGTFRPEIVGKSVKIKTGEKLLAISPLGYPVRQPETKRSHNRKPLSQLTSGLPEKDWP
jgi:nitroreductase